MQERTGRFGLHRETAIYEAGYCVLAALPGVTAMPGVATVPGVVALPGAAGVPEGDLSWLHPRERAYLDTLRVDRRRESYLIGRRAAKGAIYSIKGGRLADIEIDFGVFGFPVVKCDTFHNVQVSFSHCDGVAVALAFPEDHPMGVDLELMSVENIETMSGVLSDVERGAIERCEMGDGVIVGTAVGAAVCWTAREALSKIFRTGLTVDCKILELATLTRSEGETGVNIYTGTFSYAAQYRAVSAVIGGYVCSVVLPRKTKADLGPFFADCKATFETAPELTAL